MLGYHVYECYRKKQYFNTVTPFCRINDVTKEKKEEKYPFFLDFSLQL